MPLRIGFDMDGVLADFSAAYHAVEDRLFGDAEPPTRAGDPEEERDNQTVEQATGAERMSTASEPREPSAPAAFDGAQDAESVTRTAKRARQRVGESDGRSRSDERELRRRKDAVWQAIRNTPDFWLTLDPTDPHAVRRIHELMLHRRWEVFFITQRPATVGETVQRQTQRWLVAQGFDMPSVLVVPASRGHAARALSLDYHVDDSPKNCIDIKSESNAKPILIVDADDADTAASAKRFGIETAVSIASALDALEEARPKPLSVFERLANLAGLR